MLALTKKFTNEEDVSMKLLCQSYAKIALGTDYCAQWKDMSENAKEFEWLVHYGMSSSKAIQCATYNAGELLDKKKKIGYLKIGYFGDLIVLENDPTKDITELQRIKFVMKGGKCIVNEL